jgi:hypothetical protein
MHRDWKRAKQWAVLGVLVVAAGAEVAANVRERVKRVDEERLETRMATRESVSTHFAWCRE